MLYANQTKKNSLKCKLGLGLLSQNNLILDLYSYYFFSDDYDNDDTVHTLIRHFFKKVHGKTIHTVGIVLYFF